MSYPRKLVSQNDRPNGMVTVGTAHALGMRKLKEAKEQKVQEGKELRGKEAKERKSRMKKTGNVIPYVYSDRMVRKNLSVFTLSDELNYPVYNIKKVYNGYPIVIKGVLLSSYDCMHDVQKYVPYYAINKDKTLVFGALKDILKKIEYTKTANRVAYMLKAHSKMKFRDWTIIKGNK